MKQGNKKKLSIAIPTYNRALKVERLLNNIDNELDNHLVSDIEVLVSNNGSTDLTQELLESFRPKNFDLSIFKQENNLGFDKNIKFLYDQAKTDYVWFFSDDDIILPGAITKIYNALELFEPHITLFSFKQPPDSTRKTFDFSESMKIIIDFKRMIKLVAYYPKVSIYVVRKTEFTVSEEEEILQFGGTNYLFLALCYSVLSQHKTPRLCIISEPLASCDSEFNNIRFDPETWGNEGLIFKHTFVIDKYPDLFQSSKKNAYYSVIGFILFVKLGIFEVENKEGYELAAKKIEFKLNWLLQNPKAAVKYLALKLNNRFIFLLLKKMIKIGQQFSL